MLVIVLPEPDGDTFTGRVTLNRIWIPELADPSSPAFINMSREFTDNVSLMSVFGSETVLHYLKHIVISLLLCITFSESRQTDTEKIC